jgi:hypothetical protein
MKHDQALREQIEREIEAGTRKREWYCHACQYWTVLNNEKELSLCAVCGSSHVQRMEREKARKLFVPEQAPPATEPLPETPRKKFGDRIVPPEEARERLEKLKASLD